MSLLPERKKSAEEIARLRESFGVPPLSGAEAPAQPSQPSSPAADPVETIVPANHQATIVHTPEAVALSPQPAPESPASSRPVHSLKRSEWRSPVPPDSEARDHRHAPHAPAPTPPPASPKPVRSLKKSEQVPLPAGSLPEPPPDSKLPHHRHSAREIQEIRRREALALMNATPNPLLFPAHPALIIPGYLSALGAAVGFYFYECHMVLTLALILVSLGFSLFIFLKKPISRHHAAFISVLSLFVIVFAALHYFPQLRHAT